MTDSLDVNDGIVRVEWGGPIATITLNYPQRRNAFSLEMRHSLHETLYDLAYRDGDCRAMVLTGAGGDFCSGGDISEMESRAVLEFRERNLVALQIFDLLAGGPKPVIAAVEGVAMGAGAALAAACDYVVTAADARYACAFVKVGLLPDTGLYWSLAQRVGGGVARELMLTGREFSGEQAFRMGFANAVAESGQVLALALEQADAFAAMPPLAMAHLKAAMCGGTDTLDQAIEAEVNLQPVVRRSRDHQEAVKAFMEKRPPVFVGD